HHPRHPRRHRPGWAEPRGRGEPYQDRWRGGQQHGTGRPEEMDLESGGPEAGDVDAERRPDGRRGDEDRRVSRDAEVNKGLPTQGVGEIGWGARVGARTAPGVGASDDEPKDGVEGERERARAAAITNEDSN